MWPRGWVEAELYSSMTMAIEGGEWSAARPGCTLPLGKTRYPFYRRLGGAQGWSGHAENLVLTGIRSRTIQPVVSRYTDWATWPIYIFKSQKHCRMRLKCYLIMEMNHWIQNSFFPHNHTTISWICTPAASVPVRGNHLHFRNLVILIIQR